MVGIDCNLHGKHVHYLSKKIGKEHVFFTSTSQVFHETCEACKDPECPYNYNMAKLLKYKNLREKLLKYVFDATLDDMLAEYGICSIRSVPKLLETKSDVYSLPTYTEKNGEKLLESDKKVIHSREEFFKSLDDFNKIAKKTKKCPKRVIIKRKDK